MVARTLKSSNLNESAFNNFINASIINKCWTQYSLSLIPSDPTASSLTTGQQQQQQQQENAITTASNTIENNPSSPLTPCQLQQQSAEESISNKQVLGAFVPQCQPDGSYKPVQCHALTGFCWCVDGNGTRVQGTEERFKMPNCEG